MSFCRWSSDNFKCDVYCYEDVRGGFTTHVAGGKYVAGSPDAREPIGLPHDGATFNDETLGDMRARLVSLKEAGYRVPDWVFENVDAELAEDTAS